MHKIWNGVIDPLRYPVDATERIFVGYLATSLALAVWVYIDLRRHKADVPNSLFAFLFPKQVYLHKSAIADYKFYVVDRILFALVVPLFLVYIGPVADWASAGLERLFGPVAHPLDRDSLWVQALAMTTAVLVQDFLLFYVHYLFHRVPALWEFHKTHHSAEVMTPITAYRVHPFEVVVTMNTTALGSAFQVALFTWLTGGGSPGMNILGIPIILFVFYVVGFNLRHSHVPLGYGPVVSQVLVSPWMHQVHHSREARHFDKNMGFTFSFWDRLFGTLYVPKRGETFELGLNDGEHVRFHSVTALYFRPLTNLLRRLAKQPAKTA
jgi:sterol desaturase/sphingolipid hydroxylase (fatty acid hydroxylase superfamily)